MNLFNNILDEAINLSLYRKFYKTTEASYKKKYDKVFKDHIKDDPRNTKFRLFFPFEKDAGGLKADNEILEVLKDNGYEITPEDYYIGFTWIKGKEANKTKIGGVLKKLKRDDLVIRYRDHINDLLKAKNPETGKQQTREELAERTKQGTSKFTIVLSRHLYDLMGQSEGRHWNYDSCKRITKSQNADNFSDEDVRDNGTADNWHYIPAEFQAGYLVAYLIDTSMKSRRSGLDNRPRNEPLEDPIVRVMLIPYFNEKKPLITRLFVSKEQVYGTTTPGFVERIEEIANDIGLRAEQVPYGDYCAPYSGYTGTLDTTKKYTMTPNDAKNALIEVYGKDNVVLYKDAEGYNSLDVTIKDENMVNTYLQMIYPFGSWIKALYDGGLSDDEDVHWFIEYVLRFSRVDDNDEHIGIHNFIKYLRLIRADYEANDEDGIKDEIFDTYIQEFTKKFHKRILDALLHPEINNSFIDSVVKLSPDLDAITFRNEVSQSIRDSVIRRIETLLTKDYTAVLTMFAQDLGFNRNSWYRHVESMFNSGIYSPDLVADIREFWHEKLGKTNTQSNAVEKEIDTNIFRVVESINGQKLIFPKDLGKRLEAVMDIRTARQRVLDLNIHGETGWEVPSIDELENIYNKTGYRNAMFESYYVLSNTTFDSEDDIYVIDFEDGEKTYKHIDAIAILMPIKYI